MGSLSSKGSLSPQELEDYQDLTYLSRNEILHIHDRFKELDRETVDKRGTRAILSKEKIAGLKELKTNPFKDRIIRIFSGRRDGAMSFEDFLDMASVFSEAAPKNIKIEYAFRVYDFDGDDLLGQADIRKTVNRLVSGMPGAGDADKSRRLSSADLKDIVDKVLDEADTDGDGYLSFNEFQTAMTKAPDFAMSFRIQL